MSRYRNWCFTINNPESTELVFQDDDQIKACWYQREQGESGTEHFQGYVEFANPKALLSIKRMPVFARAHLEHRKGSRQQAVAYATKEETRLSGPYKYGDTTLENIQGKRNDLRVFKDAVDAGVDKEQAFDDYIDIAAKYPRFFREAFERRRVRELGDVHFAPRAGWQLDLSLLLQQEPDKRKIHWFYDSQGNSGKSTFACGWAGSYIVTGGKHEDIYFAYDYQPVVIFDWPRAKHDSFPYAVAESFKNGYFLSTKYECRASRFRTPHVVVFANFLPDYDSLSIDRWDVKTIKGDIATSIDVVKVSC